jgi:hypothetical protein
MDAGGFGKLAVTGTVVEQPVKNKTAAIITATAIAPG